MRFWQSIVDFFMHDKGAFRNFWIAASVLVGIVGTVIGVFQGRKKKEDKSFQISLAPMQVKIHPDSPNQNYVVGDIYCEQNNFPEAIKKFKTALKEYIELTGPASLDTARTYNSLGLAHLSLLDCEEAIECYNNAYAIYLRSSKKHNNEVAMVCNNLGLAFMRKKDFENAIRWHNKALEFDKEIFGESSQAVANDYASIGIVYEHWGKYNQAIDYYKRCTSILENILGKEDEKTAYCYFTIGTCYESLKLLDKAKEWYDKSEKRQESARGSEGNSGTAMRRFINTTGRELVFFADYKLTTKIGMMYRDAACYCILEQDAAVVVLYKVSSNGVFKIGFTDFLPGVQEG